jgi:dipeptidyl aminopeptidase/acylaminoacyl peptidase
MNKGYYRLIPILWLASGLLFPIHAQKSVTSPGFDPSALEIKPVVKTAPRPITSMDLLTIRDITGVQISPDGKSVAYVVSQAVHETNSYRTALFVIGTDSGSVPMNLGSAGPPQWDRLGQYMKIAPQWSPDGRHITYLVQVGDRKQIWRWRRERGKPEQLTQNAGDVQTYEWQPDGRRIIFTTVEPPSPEEIKRVSEQGIRYDSSIRASEGRPIASAVVEAKPRKKQIWIYNLATRTERRVTADEEAAYNEAQPSPKVFQPGDKSNTTIIRSSPDRKFIAYVSQLLDPEKFPGYPWTIFSQRSGGGEPVELVPPSELGIYGLWWSKEGSEIYFARSTGNGGTALYAVSARGGTVRDVTKGTNVLLQFSFDNDMSRIACLRENSTTPPEVAVFDLKDGVPRTLAVVNPEFQNIALSPATRLEWTNKYGDKSFGYLVKPLKYEPGKRYPLIVTTYFNSGGFLRGAVGDEYPIQVFAADGFVVLDFDAPSERLPKPGDYRTGMLRWYSPLASLETAVKMLDQMGIIDASRKGLTGLSFGAQITNFTISHSDLFQAAATSSISSVDPIWYYLTNDYGRQVYKPYGLHELPEGKGAARWKEISSALNAEKVKAPLLVQVADSEYLQGLQFYTTLREFEKPVEMIIYADEKHLKIQPKHRYEIYQRNLDWFNFWLRDKENPAVEKSEQYELWRSMRNALRKNRSQSTSTN